MKGPPIQASKLKPEYQRNQLLHFIPITPACMNSQSKASYAGICCAGLEHVLHAIWLTKCCGAGRQPTEEQLGQIDEERERRKEEGGGGHLGWNAVVMSINLVKALSNFFFYPQTQQEGGKVTWLHVDVPEAYMKGSMS
ncbi:uncharacterized [Tachysurus ichikawai]